MTKEDVYQCYLQWKRGEKIWKIEDLFESPSINFNVCESRTAVINRLFYLVPDYYGVKLRVFIFYEENTFIKEKDGDLRLIQSELKIQ